MSSVNWWISNSFWGRLWRCTSWSSHAVVALTSRALDAADHVARHLTGAHPPFGVQCEPDVGLLEPLAQPLGLGEEVRAAGLDVEDQQRLGLARRLQVAADHRVGLAQVVAIAGSPGARRPRPRSAPSRAAPVAICARRASPRARACVPSRRACRSRAPRADGPGARRSRRRRGSRGGSGARRAGARAAGSAWGSPARAPPRPRRRARAARRRWIRPAGAPRRRGSRRPPRGRRWQRPVDAGRRRTIDALSGPYPVSWMMRL